MMGPCVVQHLKRSNFYESLRKVTLKEVKRTVEKIERQVKHYEISVILRKNLDVYIQDIERCTKRKMTQKQRDLITDYVNNNRIFRLDPSSDKSGRKSFERKRSILRKEWEKETGQEWPKYEEDIKDDKGAVIRQKGQMYDAHHIVELSCGGPNVWYNLFPAKHPDEHQKGIHREYSIAAQIFDEKNIEANTNKKQDIKVRQEEKKKVINKKEKKKLVLKKIN